MHGHVCVCVCVCVCARARVQARIAAFEAAQKEHNEQAAAERLQSGAIVLPPGPRLGNKVVEINNVGKACV